ncbi:MAG: carboxymuconolactone decarboxylase family protein [Elusimicrobia bacterium]|nr:carboxymuconolactone decarboxylase family protein [Elusimicrobiota bacterium]
MPKIPYAHEGLESAEATAVYKSLKAGFGMVPNVVKLLGHSGPATRALGAVLDAYFKGLSLTPRIREVAYLTVARANGCAYCQGHHVPIAKQTGLGDGQIAALGPEGFQSPLLTEAERAVVRFAYETTKQVAASDAAIDSLKKHFSVKEVAELAFVAAAGGFIQRIGKNLGAELEIPARADL